MSLGFIFLSRSLLFFCEGESFCYFLSTFVLTMLDLDLFLKDYTPGVFYCLFCCTTLLLNVVSYFRLCSLAGHESLLNLRVRLPLAMKTPDLIPRCIFYLPAHRRF